jgi:hypothetical protein
MKSKHGDLLSSSSLAFWFLVCEPGSYHGNLVLQRGAERHDSQDAHFDCPPKPHATKRNQRSTAIGLAQVLRCIQGGD